MSSEPRLRPVHNAAPVTGTPLAPTRTSPLPSRTRTVETPHGQARIEVRAANAPSAALVLGHGAGGGIHATDLLAASEAAAEQSCTVVLVEQPYRVAGRRSPAPAKQLDAAWEAVIAHLASKELRGLRLIVGGRSAGARVTCRTAEHVGAVAVLCLAFPLHPPGKADDPAKSRLAELDAVSVPVLVVQGERDPFGMPPLGPTRQVVAISGDHSLRDATAVRRVVGPWLAAIVEN